jgi:hypothetical protein
MVLLIQCSISTAVLGTILTDTELDPLLIVDIYFKTCEMMLYISEYNTIYHVYLPYEYIPPFQTCSGSRLI